MADTFCSTNQLDAGQDKGYVWPKVDLVCRDIGEKNLDKILPDVQLILETNTLTSIFRLNKNVGSVSIFKRKGCALNVSGLVLMLKIDQ